MDLPGIPPQVPGRSAPGHPVLVVGEALVDLIPVASGPAAGELALRGRPGGSPANVAVGLARLGVPTRFAGRFSTRGFGPWRRDLLRAEGVDVTLSVDSDRATTLATVSVDATGAPSYEFYGPDTADWWWSRRELPEPAGLAGWTVHTGSLATAMPPGSAVLSGWLGDVRDAGRAVVSYDPNVRPTIVGPPERCRAAAEPYVRLAHLVKVSEEDLLHLYPGVAPLEAAEAWLAGASAGGPELVVVTRGAAGSVALHRRAGRVTRPAPAVQVADAVGAGDAFMSGLLAHLRSAGLLTPEALAGAGPADLAAALQRATIVAAVTCTRPGADPPRAHEVMGPAPHLP